MNQPPPDASAGDHKTKPWAALFHRKDCWQGQFIRLIGWVGFAWCASHLAWGVFFLLLQFELERVWLLQRYEYRNALTGMLLSLLVVVAGQGLIYLRRMSDRAAGADRG